MGYCLSSGENQLQTEGCFAKQILKPSLGSFKLLPSNLITFQKQKVPEYLGEYKILSNLQDKIHNAEYQTKNYQACRKEENGTHNMNKKQSVEKNSEMTLMRELAKILKQLL